MHSFIVSVPIGLTLYPNKLVKSDVLVVATRSRGS
jgi:hypothetical protein